MSPLCQLIGVFLYCTTAGPPTAQVLQPQDTGRIEYAMPMSAPAAKAALRQIEAQQRKACSGPTVAHRYAMGCFDPW